jgi:hypothetical protein
MMAEVITTAELTAEQQNNIAYGLALAYLDKLLKAKHITREKYEEAVKKCRERLKVA